MTVLQYDDDLLQSNLLVISLAMAAHQQRSDEEAVRTGVLALLLLADQIAKHYAVLIPDSDIAEYAQRCHVINRVEAG